MIAEARSPPVTERGEQHLSYSSISLYRSCSLRWYFKYVAGLPERIVTASLVYGGAIHAALQHHFEQLLVGDPAPGRDVLLDVFWHAWHTRGDEQKILFGQEDVNSLGRLADRTLTAFQASTLARPEGVIVGVEEPLRGELAPGVPDLVGRVDLMVETDDALVLSDWKTARSSWSQNQVQDSADQLLIYHTLAQHLAGDKPIVLQFVVMTKGKWPEVSVHQVEANPQQIERTKKIVERVWRAIEFGNFVPSPSAMNCANCPFRQPCREWSG